MTGTEWMIYGATGYTGTLVAEEALRRGQRPILAGRSAGKLTRLVGRLGLNHVTVRLDDGAALEEALSGVDLVFHAAGPFVFTSEPMIRACLATGTHYVDITGELVVFENTFSYDEVAREKGITLMSGAGFDVIPSDCMAKYVADQVPGAVELELAIAAMGSGTSAGTAKTAIEFLTDVGVVRRDGKLVPYPFGEGVRGIRFSHRELTVLPLPWGDLSTAYWTTGIPNITTYLAWPPRQIRQIRRSLPVVQALLKVKLLRRLVQAWIGRTVKGPDEHARQTGRSYIWARAADKEGNEAQAWLETIESYRLTAEGGVRCVERILEERPSGALTPAGAFGADLALEIEGTRRIDTLPG